MPLIDFLITNPGHHAAMMLPVMQVLRRRGHCCRGLSLCELRGFDSPSRLFSDLGFELERVIRANWRLSPSSGSRSGLSAHHPLRTTAHRLLWTFLIRPGLRQLIHQRPHALVMPNDGAFPFDRICELFRAIGVPVVIVQEGIRFDRPAGTRDGACGADLYAVWGPSSEAYFRGQGVPDERIAVTGNPRFDVIDSTDWSRTACEGGGRPDEDSDTLLFLSNPIDDLGFVSTRRKLDLFQRFASGLCPLMADSGLRLAVKIHGRESLRSFEEAAAGLPCSDRIDVVRDTELYSLIASSRAAVMFGSTAGLEVLLFGKPLAVLEIPGFGFLHDFVASGAARGLVWSSPVHEQVEQWLSTCTRESPRVRRFLDETVTSRGRSSEVTADAIERTLVG